MLAMAIGVADEPWKRHTIDKSSKGADGVRLMDVNAGRPARRGHRLGGRRRGACLYQPRPEEVQIRMAGGNRWQG